MRVECLNAKFAYSTQLPISRLVASVGSSEKYFSFLFFWGQTFFTFLELHNPTMFYGGRPYGVGLLVAGYDVRNIYLFTVFVLGILCTRIRGLISIKRVLQRTIMTARQWLLGLDLK